MTDKPGAKQSEAEIRLREVLATLLDDCAPGPGEAGIPNAPSERSYLAARAVMAQRLTVDGVEVVVGDRILEPGEPPLSNGVYVVSDIEHIPDEAP